MAGLDHNTAVQGLDLDGVAAILDLHLSPGVAREAGHAGSRGSIALGAAMAWGAGAEYCAGGA